MAAFGFVDDMDYIQTALDHENEVEVLQKTKRGVKLWGKLLRVTGGAIETSETKTDWVNIEFVWIKEKWKIKKKNEEKEIYVRNFNGDEVKIKQLQPTTARETLGVMQTVTGDEQPQMEKIVEKN